MSKAEEQTNRFNWVSHLRWNHSNWFKFVISIIHFKRFTSKIQFKRAIHFRISTLLVMILKSTYWWVKPSFSKLRNSSIIVSQNDWLFLSAPIRSRIANHLIQIGISERGSRIFLFRSELRRGFVNFLIQIGSSQRVCASFCELNDSRSMLRSPDLKWWFGNHYSDPDYEERIANH